MAFGSYLFYFWYGVFATIYFYILFFKKSESSSSSQQNSQNEKSGKQSSINYGTNKESYVKKIYLNMYFVDRKEVVRNIIRSKVPRSRPIIRALAKRAAVALLEKGIVERVASMLCQAIPERMEMMGVKANVSLGYTMKAYACIELTMVSLDFHKFLAFNAGKDKATAIMNAFERFSIPAVNNWLQRTLLEFMAGKMKTNLPITMKEKLYGKMNAEVEIIPCSEEEQGPYLVQTIALLGVDVSPKDGKEKESSSAKDDMKDEE
jgi:hypothetical protein